MADCIPYYDMGEAITSRTSAAAGLVGCRFVKVDPGSGWSPVGLKGDVQLPPAQPSVNANVMDVLPCTAGAKSFGVATRDAAQYKLVTIIRSPGVVVPVEVGAAVLAGDEVESDASGRAIKLATGRPCGIAIGPQATVGGYAPIALY